MSNCTIVIPCYNEAERLDAAAFRRYLEQSISPQFLFVNDGSRDRTREVLESLRQFSPARVKVYDMPRNMGKAEAVRHGINHALSGSVDYVGYWDADLATPLDLIPDFCRLLDCERNLLMVLGSRVKLLGKNIERRAMRHYFGRVFATGASLVLGLPVYDTQCGAKLFRICPEIRGLFNEPFRTHWIFDVEILARFLSGKDATARKAAESRLYEYPLPEWHDVPGSKVKPWDFFKAFYELAIIRWRYMGRRK
jgi:dolichyl-phosphate beta-glucosyltransferase